MRRAPPHRLADNSAMPPATPPTPDAALVLQQTREWLEKAVIGLNLCPFAKAVHVKGQIRYVVSAASDTPTLRAELVEEMQRLVDADPERVDTTLLIHPGVLGDFLDFNDFFGEADDALDELGLDGVLQVASFHPHYQFAGCGPDDISNHSNRSPYPMLHLLREASVDAAVAAFPQAEAIYERNIETLERLGHAGWARLFKPA